MKVKNKKIKLKIKKPKGRPQWLCLHGHSHLYKIKPATHFIRILFFLQFARVFINMRPIAFTKQLIGSFHYIIDGFQTYGVHTCRYDESSECETARQHKVEEVACYRSETNIDGGTPESPF